MLRLKTVLRAMALIAIGVSADDDVCTEASIAPVLWLPAMNVFRRFAGAHEPMFRFYTDVLGFEPLTTFDVGDDTQVHRIKAGDSELKLSRHEEGRTYLPGGVTGATGLRLWTFFFSDEDALVGRFEGAGLPAPEFTRLHGGHGGHGHKGRRGGCGPNPKSALVADPDGQLVQLIITGDAPGTNYSEIEAGFVVSDLEVSIPFYRDFIGLDDLGSEYDPLFDTTKHVFRHGSTIVTLRSFGDDLPADTGSSGIQYVVSDADRVEELALCQDVTIDKPLSTIPGFTVRTIWLDDPDGITNYFAETAESRGET